MFVREVKTAHHSYLRLVENFRRGPRVQQRVVAHLGRKDRSEEHTSELQSQSNLVCRLLLEKKKKKKIIKPEDRTTQTKSHEKDERSVIREYKNKWVHKHTIPVQPREVHYHRTSVRAHSEAA